VEVVATVQNGLRVRRPDGTEMDFIPSSAAASFDVGEARELKVAAGDWLLLQANAPGFVNGERVQLQEIRHGRITLADGRQLPAGFNSFTHGYSVTSHSSQGKTVDEVLLVASSRSFAAVNREQFYVSISRGRERVHVFTDDADLLARRVTGSHERKAAVELQALRDELAKLGFVRKEQLKDKITTPASTARQDFRTARPMRQTRTTRLSPVQRLVQVAEQVRRWMGEHFEPKELVTEKVTEKIEQTESVKPTEKLRRSLREEVRQSIEQHRRQQPRHSRGIGH